MGSSEAELLDWASERTARKWPGAAIGRAQALKGDLSTRRFFRLSLKGGASRAPATAILVDLGPDDFPAYVRALGLLPEAPDEPPWLNVHRFLSAIGAPVPALYEADSARRVILIEDVGGLPLALAARRKGADVADLFRLAVEQLFVFHVTGTARLDGRCIASRIAYDERLFGWEIEQYRDQWCAIVAPGADPAAVAPDLKALARELGRLPRVFSHRDYHGQNLFIQNGPALRIIDFQDALMAPAAQDLAVLMTTRDTATLIPDRLERRLLDFYHTGLVRRGAAALPHDEFLRSYRLCVLQHALKMLARFRRFADAGKPEYEAYVPHCIAQARRILAGPDVAGFPALAALFAAADTAGGPQ
jgi:aminoglycoside/choline kinase family phosphotransferase